MSLTVHLALVFHVFIAVAVMVMVCGCYGIGPQPVQTYVTAINTLYMDNRQT